MYPWTRGPGPSPQDWLSNILAQRLAEAILARQAQWFWPNFSAGTRGGWGTVGNCSHEFMNYNPSFMKCHLRLFKWVFNGCQNLKP